MKYRELKGWKYELAEPEWFETGICIPADIDIPFISLMKDGFLIIDRGYAWDGPSGPTIDTKTFMRPSLPHDVLYQLIRMGLLPKERRADADALLRRLCREDGMSAFRAAYVYAAVRMFGNLFSRSDKRDAESALLEAP